MGAFPVVIIIIIVIIIIGAVIAIAVIGSRSASNSSDSNECQNNTDCETGFVCIVDVTPHVCKASTGTACTTDSDCAPNLICSDASVCTSVSEPRVRQNNKRRVAWSRTRMIPKPSIIHATESEVVAPKYDSVPEPELEVSTRINTPRTHESPQPKPLSARTTTTPVRVRTPIQPPPIIQQPVMQQPPVIQQPPRQFVVASRSSDDDEINSADTRRDVAFEVLSESTTRDVRPEIVSTPCQEKDGAYYCKKADIIENTTNHSAIVDVCSYSDATVFVLENGNIIYETQTRTRITNNVHIRRIASFQGYLYGIGIDRKLYMLSTDYITKSTWQWTWVDWAPLEITHMSCTQNASHLWIQTANHGHLYNAPSVMISKTEISNMRRIYGRDTEHYIEINDTTHAAIQYPSRTVTYNVLDAGLSYYDDLITIDTNQNREYRSVVIVNWKPYYIRI